MHRYEFTVETARSIKGFQAIKSNSDGEIKFIFDSKLELKPGNVYEFLWNNEYIAFYINGERQKVWEIPG